MTGQSPREQREHDFMLQVFAISAGMVGVCLTAIGILRLMAAQSRIETIGDEILAGDAVLFVLCCFLCFWSFKARSDRTRGVLRMVVDGLFMAALSIMVGVCSVIAYALA